jgi:hypothetical protein
MLMIDGMGSSHDFTGIVVPKSLATLRAPVGEEESVVKDTTISVDVAKSVFELAVSNRPGHVHSTHRLPRARFLSFFVDRAPSNVVMEACGSAYFWARKIEQLGHHVVLLPAHAIRPATHRRITDERAPPTTGGPLESA